MPAERETIRSAATAATISASRSEGAFAEVMAGQDIKIANTHPCYNSRMLTETGKKSLRREMEALLGPGAVLSDPDELLVYESDGLTLFRALADFVVVPDRPPSTCPPSSSSPTARACPSWRAAPAPGCRAAACPPRAASSSR